MCIFTRRHLKDNTKTVQCLCRVSCILTFLQFHLAQSPCVFADTPLKIPANLNIVPLFDACFIANTLNGGATIKI